MSKSYTLIGDYYCDDEPVVAVAKAADAGATDDERVHAALSALVECLDDCGDEVDAASIDRMRDAERTVLAAWAAAQAAENTAVTRRHRDLDLAISVSADCTQAWLEFGGAFNPDNCPVDGEVIRARGRLWKVGEMDTSAPPLLYEVHEWPELGLWWDADDPDQCDDE